jgi:AAA+ superfamily predicted ATPase
MPATPLEPVEQFIKGKEMSNMKFRLKNKMGNVICELPFDADGMLAEAEKKAGDPVINLVRLAVNSLNDNGFNVPESEQASLVKLLSQAAAHPIWPDCIDVVANPSPTKTVPFPAKKDVPSLSLAQMELFERIIQYPNSDARMVFDGLVGLEEQKSRLIKEATLLIAPEQLQQWGKLHLNGKVPKAAQALKERPPLIVFGGDVGTGKTALAECFGDAVARLLSMEVDLLRLSLKSRGTGLVGEITKLVSDAFKTAFEYAKQTKRPIILLLDEADALAQSREAAQMHHEDRAGVNALIQGIDQARMPGVQMLVVFATNRLNALDPAIRRRAAQIYEFNRPNTEQRRVVFQTYLSDLGISSAEMDSLVLTTGPAEKRSYGYTYSDIINRLIPNAIIEAFPNQPLSFYHIQKALACTPPTRPFKGEDE